MLNTLINFLTNPLGWIILVGLFSAGSRVFREVQERHTEKLAIQQRRERERDALRTGRMAEPEPEKAQESAGWDERQQSKRERIEQLRQQRIEQLRKLREQRLRAKASTQSGSAQTPTIASAATQQPSPTQSPRRGTGTRAPTPTQGAPHLQAQNQSPTQAQRQAQRQSLEPTRASSSRPAQRQPRPQSPQRAQPVLNNADASTPKISDLKPIAEKGVTLKGTGDPQPTPGIAKRFRGRRALRDAIIAQEVLSPPLALR